MGVEIEPVLTLLPKMVPFATSPGLVYVLRWLTQVKSKEELFETLLRMGEAAAHSGRVSALKIISDYLPEHTTFQARYFSCAMVRAIFGQQLAVIRYCVAHPQFNPNLLVQDETPLMIAAREGNLIAQRLLLQHPLCEPRLENALGQSALTYAKQAKQPSCITALEREVLRRNAVIAQAVQERLDRLTELASLRAKRWAHQMRFFGSQSTSRIDDESVHLPLFQQLYMILRRYPERPAESIVQEYMGYISKRAQPEAIAYIKAFAAEAGIIQISGEIKHKQSRLA